MIGLQKSLDIGIFKIFLDDSHVQPRLRTTGKKTGELIIINNYNLCATYYAKHIIHIISFNLPKNPHFPDEEACSDRVREQ